MKNYIRDDRRFSAMYTYLDVEEYVADSLFYKREIPVKFITEFVKDGEKYRFIICKVRRKYIPDFEKAMEELKVKMALVGHTDYEQSCKRIMGEMFGV